ncbi:hypothetical protein EXIGLDRAFT_802962 [Exidia glandulosa HHB12029]|uniref:Alpha-type protein kinase domain-containing protein n=1 Tax=Exidia glandulosa HHB12029 TaxID=1314781 RepID=A0A165MKZ8_EXIGL|nr:hypothetical protein EXIGLDRAFT_802962 [Exidia glandulosa HHB12029]
MPPRYDTQSSKFLKSQSETFPCIPDFVQSRLEGRTMQQLDVFRTDFFSATEAAKLRRSGELLHQEGLSTLEVDVNPSTYRHGEPLAVMIGPKPRSKHPASFHYECVTCDPIDKDNTDCHWIAKEFRATILAVQWETMAEDFGIGLATLRDYLSEFTAQAAVHSMPYAVNTVRSVMFTTTAESPRVFLCQTPLEGTTVRSAGNGLLSHGPLGPSSPQQILHALSHWTYQHSNKEYVFLSFAAKLHTPADGSVKNPLTVFGYRQYMKDTEEFKTFLANHTCCRLCNALDLYSLRAL